MTKDTKEAFEKTRAAGIIASGALDEVRKIIKPGISTSEIDKICYEFINDHKAYSAPLFYRGYPKSCCTSANHVVCHGVPSDKILKEAKDAILSVGADPENPNIRWQAAKYDNSWIRDNGPVYVVEENRFRIQNWEFNAWGGGFGTNIPFYLDNSVPDQIGKILQIPVDHIDIVHERGNLEFNGLDTVMLNWSTIGDPNRNIGYTKEQLENDLKQYFGVSKVILIEGIPHGDRTRGHIDGIARFINVSTVVVLQCTTSSYCKPDSRDGRLFDQIGETIEAAGFNVIREPIESYVEYNGQKFDTNYVNWLLGNGFVIAPGFGNPKTDAAAKSRIENYFPNRDVYIVEMLNSWAAGGGVHCHTNDQPAQSILE